MTVVAMLSASTTGCFGQRPQKQEFPDKDATALAIGRFTAGLVTGTPQSTEFAIAQDIATTLAAKQETGPHGEVALRVLPMIGNGGSRNLLDILTLPGADMAIVPVILASRLRTAMTLSSRNSPVYIASLFPLQFHLLARADIKSLADLAGKKISLGEEGSASAVLGLEVLNALDVKADTGNLDLRTALESMRNGDIAAALLVSAKPIEALAPLAEFSAVHLISLPVSESLGHDYLPATITHGDYPTILGVDETVSTIAVRSALFVYPWSKGSGRYALMDNFVETFFSRFPEFLTGSHHPAWRQVDLADTLPGWQRFQPAARWFKMHSGAMVSVPEPTTTGTAPSHIPLFPGFRQDAR
jgi:TRAP-type uncharacterized transport system substrate-binding protein